MQPRVIDVNRKDKAEAGAWLAKLDGKAPLKILAGAYGKGAQRFIQPDSPPGKLLGLGWKAVPALLDASADDTLTPGKRA